MMSTASSSRTEPSPQQIKANLLEAHRVALEAMKAGKHPFGAVLIGPDHETVLFEQGNVDTVNHAESTLARTAATHFTKEELWDCTLYTTVEPCCHVCRYTSIGPTLDDSCME